MANIMVSAIPDVFHAEIGIVEMEYRTIWRCHHQHPTHEEAQQCGNEKLEAKINE